MTPALDGLFVWMWNVSQCDGGDPAAICARLKAAGATGAIVKVCDGVSRFNTGVDLVALRAAFVAHGLTFATWGYNYGYAPTAEGQLAGSLCALLQPAFHVLDIEQEVENNANPASAAQAIVAAILAQTATPLCYSPLPAIRYHLKLPYRQLTDAGLPMLPQLYWTGLGWTPAQTVGWFYSDADKYNLLTQPVYPAYEDAPGARPTGADLGTFLDLIKQAKATGASVWSYEHLDAGGWQRAATVAAALTPPVPPVPDPPQPVPTSTRIAVAQIAAELVSAALDPGMSDDEALADVDTAERQLYTLLYQAGMRKARKG